MVRVVAIDYPTAGRFLDPHWILSFRSIWPTGMDIRTLGTVDDSVPEDGSTPPRDLTKTVTSIDRMDCA